MLEIVTIFDQENVLIVHLDVQWNIRLSSLTIWIWRRTGPSWLSQNGQMAYHFCKGLFRRHLQPQWIQSRRTAAWNSPHIFPGLHILNCTGRCIPFRTSSLPLKAPKFKWTPHSVIESEAWNLNRCTRKLYELKYCVYYAGRTMRGHAKLWSL